MRILQTERLVLRHITRDDAPFLLELLNDPYWIRFIGDRGVRTVEAAETYMEDKIIKSYRENGYGLFLVESRITKEAIGLSGLVNRAELDDVDIGFAFLAEHTGKGYGYESASAVMEYAKQKLKLRRIVAITDEENIRSIALVEKLGLSFEKKIKLGKEDDMLLLFGWGK